MKETVNTALISLEALREIKREMPLIRTVMGVSNGSYECSQSIE